MAPAIDWDSDESHILLNPARRRTLSPRLEVLPGLPGHIWLATSGTSANRSEIKLVALSKKAFLASAAAVNSHLQVESKDGWFLALPHFHVGGLSIYARAHLSSGVIKRWSGVGRKWNVRRFYDELSDSGCSLVSLVPTQVWDLVTQKLRAPKFLKAVVVGGGALSRTCYDRGRLFGWPLLPSYGFTECCSQVATAELKSLERSETPRLRILSHIRARTNAELELSVKSPSLLTGMATITGEKVEFRDPKVTGWFHTEDKVALSGDYLSFLGRGDDCVKIKGKIVSRLGLQGLLEQILSESGWREEAVIVILDDPRRGNRVALAVATADKDLVAAVTDKFNQEVLSHERIGSSHRVRSLPRTELGKVKLTELAARLT